MFCPLYSSSSEIFTAPDVFKRALLCTSAGGALLAAEVMALVTVTNVSAVLLATVVVDVLVGAVGVVVDMVAQIKIKEF